MTAAINWVMPTTVFLMWQLIVASRSGRAEYQLLLMKVWWWDRNVKIIKEFGCDLWIIVRKLLSHTYKVCPHHHQNFISAPSHHRSTSVQQQSLLITCNSRSSTYIIIFSMNYSLLLLIRFTVPLEPASSFTPVILTTTLIRLFLLPSLPLPWLHLLYHHL